jgi:hypothetical protein
MKFTAYKNLTVQQKHVQSDWFHDLYSSRTRAREEKRSHSFIQKNVRGRNHWKKQMKMGERYSICSEKTWHERADWTNVP